MGYDILSKSWKMVTRFLKKSKWTRPSYLMTLNCKILGWSCLISVMVSTPFFGSFMVIMPSVCFSAKNLDSFFHLVFLTSRVGQYGGQAGTTWSLKKLDVKIGNSTFLAVVLQARRKASSKIISKSNSSGSVIAAKVGSLEFIRISILEFFSNLIWICILIFMTKLQQRLQLLGLFAYVQNCVKKLKLFWS